MPQNNARGWLSNINNGGLSNDPLTSTDTNDQFGEDLKYDDAATPQYNGNIGSVKTLTTALLGTSYPALTYNYKYDKLNRLINAVSTTTTGNDNYYNENMTYDVMGNIQKLNRYDKVSGVRTAIDSLTYTYVSGNRVDRIDDAVSGGTYGFLNGANQAGEYTYDGNGNQLVDLNKGLTQQYNMLNLPQTAVKGTTSLAYIYDATGRKLRKLSTTGSTTTITEYINGIEYDYTGSTPILSFIQTEEGRARKTGTVYKYEYDLKDHLGNTRMTTTWNASDATQLTPLNLQRSDYYAFGYTIQSLIGSTPSPKNEYLYNHKELQEETGLYDYGARLYDPVIARWANVDPLAEEERKASPYNYTFDDPIRHTDPDGMFGEGVNDDPCCGVIAQDPVSVSVEVGAAIVAGAIIGGTAIIISHHNSNGDPVMPIDNARVTSSVPAIAPTIVKSSKGANKLLPNTSAGGDHSTFKVDKDGKIIGYAEYSKNPKNPSGFDQKKRVDVKGGDHHDKKTGKKIPTPHVHEGDDTRPARPDELPNPTPPTPSIPNAAPVTPQPLPTTQP